MSTAVSGSTLNFPASSVAANSDTGRNTANGTLGFSFSDLLCAQSSIDSRTSFQLADTRPTPEPVRTPSPSPSGTSREAPRTDSSTPASRPQASRPSQEPTREHVKSQDNPTEIGPKIQEDTTPPPDAGTPTTGTSTVGTPAKDDQKASGNIATTDPTLQPQLADVTISPDLPATIAALLNGIAGSGLAKNNSDTEASTQDVPTHGHSRHPGTSGNLFARIAPPTAMPADVEMESNTDGDGDTNQNAPALLAGRTFKNGTAPNPQAALVSGNGNEPVARINAAALEMPMNAASAVPITPREDARAPGTTASAGDISILNPLRLPTQAGASLPQFTIPSGTSQKAWAEEVGNRVMWMLGRAQSRAELILTPPLLGKVEISIHLNGDQGTAQFLASSQSAREALEQAMPRLRELLAQAGISLGEASVNTSAEDRAHENTGNTGMRTPDSHDGGGDGDATVIAAPNWSRVEKGLINTFA